MNFLHTWHFWKVTAGICFRGTNVIGPFKDNSSLPLEHWRKSTPTVSLHVCLPKDNSGRFQRDVDGWVMDVWSSKVHCGFLLYSQFSLSFPSPLLEMWNLLSCKPLLCPLHPLPSRPVPSVWEWEARLRGYDRVAWLCCCWNPNHEYHILCVVRFKLLHFSEDVAAGWFLTPW